MTALTDPRSALVRLLGADEVHLEPLTAGTSRQTFAVTAQHGADTSAFVLQQHLAGDDRSHMDAGVEAALLRAVHTAGVPVPAVVAASTDEDLLGRPFVLTRKVTGESIPRRILRDPALATAREGLAFQLGVALARMQSLDPTTLPDLDDTDVLTSLRDQADTLGLVRPALELAFAWLERRRPPKGPTVLVHGDFRVGNLLVDENGLASVLDWELAHLGDPFEDLGYLCVPSWRFGGDLPVGGVGTYEQLFAGYRSETAGEPPDPDAFRWWRVFGTLRWGVICGMQVQAFLGERVRSHELAAVGRRISETERDLLVLTEDGGRRLGGPADDRTPGTAASVRGAPVLDRPSAAELLDALDGWLATAELTGPSRYEGRVARTIVGILRREADLGPALLDEWATLLADVGVADEAELAAGIRLGLFDDRLAEVRAAVRRITDGRLTVNDPTYRGEPES